jgi:glutathione S-transferase
VPALALDNGTVLTEGPPSSSTWPTWRRRRSCCRRWATLERYKVLGWLNYISSELHKNFSPLFNPAATEDMKAHARKMLGLRLKHVAAQLAAATSWKRASAWPTPTCSRCSAGPIS